MKAHPRPLAIILAIAVLAACTPAPTAAPTAKATPTPTAIPTNTPTTTPAPTNTPTIPPTPEPTATATEVVNNTEVSISQFLAGEGEYSDEELGSRLFFPAERGDNIENDLGVIFDFENKAYIQGVLLASEIIDDESEYGKKVAIWFGTKNSMNDRVVYIFHYDEYNYNLGYISMNWFVTSRSMKSISTHHDLSNDIRAETMEDQLTILRQRQGQVMMVFLDYETEMTVEYEKQLMDRVISKGGSTEDSNKYIKKGRMEKQVASNLMPYLFKVNKDARNNDLSGTGPGGIDAVEDLYDISIFDCSISAKPQFFVFVK